MFLFFQLPTSDFGLRTSDSSTFNTDQLQNILLNIRSIKIFMNFLVNFISSTQK
jgi:hypothetical protein